MTDNRALLQEPPATTFALATSSLICIWAHPSTIFRIVACLQILVMRQITLCIGPLDIGTEI